jgi:cytoskeletal protein CcmA (bactofilin family)
MFGKRHSHSNNITVIGRGARFTGTLELEGDVHVEGQCEGKILAQGQLSIGPHGSLRGELAGGVVVIAGNVEGTLIANERLHVTKTGNLRGEVFYGQLQVDPGGVIDGKAQKGPSPSLTKASAAPDASSNLDAASQDPSRVIDTRPKLTSVRPPTTDAPRSTAPARR